MRSRDERKAARAQRAEETKRKKRLAKLKAEVDRQVHKDYSEWRQEWRFRAAFLKPLLLRGGCNDHEATVGAEDRASILMYVAFPYWLPTDGLDGFRAELEREGFVFDRPGNQVITIACFPDGWKVAPAENRPGANDYSSFVYLLDPNDKRRAQIFYRSSIAGGSLKPTIRKV